MSMPETPARPPSGPGKGTPGSVTTSLRRRRVRLLVALAVVVVIAGTLAALDDWATGAGALCGGGLVFALVWLAARRAARRGADAATAERVFSGRGDERDSRVYLTTLAVIGGVAVVVAGLLPAAVNLGLDSEAALQWLPYLLLATGVVAFITTDRRT